jgi:hypothetical protein
LTWIGAVVEGAAIVSAAKIAAIALHIMPWTYCALVDTRRGAATRCFNSLLGVGRSLFGSADFSVPAPGNRSDSL